MLLNLQNPHLRQVVVILDSVSDNTTDCPGFVKYMSRKLDKMTRSSSLLTSAKENTRVPQLECIERREPFSGQPTYHEMFLYATHHSSITSDKVIMSNADQVFDETLSHALQMSHNTIFVLSTHGYSVDEVPPSIRKHYQSMTGNYADGTIVIPNRCPPASSAPSAKSWDSYVFHRSLLRRAFPVNGNGTLTRLNFWREPTAFYMNEPGAENTALHDIAQELQENVTIWAACNIIRSWHFHFAHKMYRTDNPVWPKQLQGGYLVYEDSLIPNTTGANVPGLRVPPPYAHPRLCSNVSMCHSDNYG